MFHLNKLQLPRECEQIAKNETREAGRKVRKTREEENE